MPIDPRNPPLLAWAMAAGRGILSPYISFLSLLVFVLRIKRKGPRYFNSEFNSYTIYAHVTLCQKGAYISFILIIN